MKNRHLLLLSCFAINISLFSKDIYIPSLPAIADELQISSALAGASITLFLIGTAISQLVFGTLSDSKGRKPVLLWGLGLCCIGNAASFFANSSTIFLFWRFFAGFGAGACTVITRAMANDLYKDSALTKFASYLSMTTVISPLIAPIIGGAIQEYVGWRANFVLLTLLTILCFISFNIIMTESNPFINTNSFNLKKIINNSWEILRCKLFLFYSLLSIIAFTPTIIYLVITPFIMQNKLGLTALENGFIYIYIAIGYFIGTLLTNKLAGKIDDDTIILFGISLAFFGALTMLCCYFLIGTTVYALTLPMLINVIGSGLITPVANKQGIALFATIAGLSAAIIGSLRMLGAFIAVSLIPLLHINGHATLALALIMLATINIGIFFCKKPGWEQTYLPL